MLKSKNNEFVASPKTKETTTLIRKKILNGESITAGIIGAGRSGKAAYALLQKYNISTEFFDDSTEYRDILAENLIDLNLVILSPGVPRKHPELVDAISSGKLIGEVEFASWFTNIPVIGITGTNGKSTTTALLGHILEGAGLQVFVGGNLGRPFSELSLSEEDYEIAVIELSSYQLESLVEAQFEIGCWLNLTEDHTDRYENLDAYARAKSCLLESCAETGIHILNAQDSYCRSFAREKEIQTRWFSLEEDSVGSKQTASLLDGAGRAVRMTKTNSESYSLNNMFLLGEHNHANMLAAIECARHMNVSVEAVQQGLNSFKGLKHRIELIRTHDAVRWYNDSKATNVESAITALRAMDAPVILIAGGTDKGGSWAPMLKYTDKIKAVLAIGDATPIVLDAFSQASVERESCGDLKKAVERARELAVSEDIVLLSPACSSFDQFDNYVHRGNVFRELVLAIDGGTQT